MAITLKRQLTDIEKEVVIKQHGRNCFADGHAIPEGESVHFDHIRAYAIGGLSEVNNIAPMCPEHNRAKGTLSLFDFRTKLELESFFNSGDRLTLGHLLGHLRSEGTISDYGLAVDVQQRDDILRLESSKLSQDYEVYSCPITGWKYFYSMLPIDILDSDDDKDQVVGLQPRYLIFDKVFSLFRHFQANPILQPSLGRIVDNRIKLFDGQHKAAALLWNGHRELECKIYVDPDLRLLNQTNISAHDKFAQTRFYSSIMVLKLGSQFGVDFDTYKNLEDGQVKSEEGFVKYLREKDSLTSGDVNSRFRSFLYNSILEDEENRLTRLVSATNYPTDEKPITMNSLTNSLFANFLYRQPVVDNMTTDAYMRTSEIQTMVRLMNMLDELALSRWDSKGSSGNEDQRRLERIIRSRFMKAWSQLLKDAVCTKLEIFDGDERTKPLYREYSEEDYDKIRFLISRLVEWKMWSSPANGEIDQIRLDNDGAIKDWLREKGLTVSYLLGASE